MRHSFNRIGIIFALLITMGATSVSASNAHHCLIGEPIATWKTTDNWSKSYEEFALTSPANTSWDEFCIYMWVETNQTFAFNNHFFNPGDAKQVGPSSDQATINKDGGTGVGVATDGTTNAWKYTGATGLVKICAAQSSGDGGQGEWKPYVWVEESKEIEILKGNKIMFYFGMTTSWNENWNVLRTSNTSEKTADQQYHRLPESKCSSWISVAYVSPAQYYVGKTGWAGVQMESTAEAGCLYSVYNDGSDKIYKNVSVGAIPHFSTTMVNKTVGTVDSEIAATVTNSIYGNEQVLYYYYTTDGGTTFTKFDPSDISSLAVGVYTVYALGWDGHILVRSDNSVTLNVGVTISLNANGGTDGDVTSVFATSGVAASTGNIASASLPTKTGYTFNGFWTSGGTEVIDSNGAWKNNVSGYTDNTGKWICSVASTLYAHWTPKPYTINLEGMEADSEEPIQVNVTYDGNLSQVTPHTKTNYTFDGYWVRNESTLALETQLIDANGNWIADVTGYTGNDGAGNPTWIHDYAISLYAKWTEIKHTVAVAVSPSGAGSVQVSGANITEVTNVGVATKSAEMTPVANAGWVFKEWQVSSANLQMDLISYHSNYQKEGTNAMKVNATADNQILTAVFEPRYYLVGGEITGTGDGGSGTESGMPGWGNYNKPFNLVTNSPILATCSLTLGSNKNFYIMVRDKADGLSYGKSGGTSLGDDASITFTDQDNKVLFYSNGGTNYTFKITAVDGSGRPTVSVERPHQMHFAHKRVDIDGNEHNDDLGGTLTATINGEPAIDEQWFDYGSDVAWTATAETGYSLTWYTDNAYSNAMNPQPSASWNDPDITHDENIYAKFTEKSTSVTLANDGHGKIQISGVDKTNTTVGVTTTRSLTAVPNEGYKFGSWTKVSGDDITLSSSSENPTTLTGNGAGETVGQEVRANFTYRYSIKGTMNGENWGTDHLIANIGTNAGSKDTGYVEMNLPANATYEFAIQDLTGADIWFKNGANAVYNMTYTNHTNWSFGTDKTYNCGITTAGKGTYKFIFNITDKTMTVIYPTSYQVNYGASVGGSVTSVKDDDNNNVPNGGYVRSGGSVTYTAAAANEYYTFAGWCTDDTYTTQFTDVNPWTNSTISANSNAYAKFKSTNFVIYRTGDMAEDDRAALDDVESYEGGTISETIEFRMKVHTLDQWYTLCLPFTVNAVMVWDPDDGPEYYDIVPFYRSGGRFYTGHYIIRKPETVTNYAIETFEERWVDPENSGVLPATNTPYIIQWHDPYFLGKYISFFGSTNQAIPSDFNAGEAPSADDVVNVFGNNTMHSGTVRDAYLLDKDYGPSGAWLREDIGTDRTILPFECFIRASQQGTARYRIIRRGMEIDTPTALEQISNHQSPMTIRVYTITGVLIGEYNDCSFQDAAHRIATDHNEGIYILRSENESMKLLLGGK